MHKHGTSISNVVCTFTGNLVQEQVHDDEGTCSANPRTTAETSKLDKQLRIGWYQHAKRTYAHCNLHTIQANNTHAYTLHTHAHPHRQPHTTQPHTYTVYTHTHVHTHTPAVHHDWSWRQLQLLELLLLLVDVVEVGQHLRRVLGDSVVWPHREVEVVDSARLLL